MASLKNQPGASLIELMMATVLGIWLLGGVLLCYLSNQKTHQVEQALAHMQENGRIAIHLLSQDIHTAGYSGCLPLNSLEFAHFTTATRIAGWHQRASTSAVQLPTDIARNAVINSDVLFIQSMIPDEAAVINAHDKTITLSATPDYKTGDILLIADCTHANIIQVTAVKGKVISITPALPDAYNTASQIGRLASIYYYIRKTTRKNAAGTPIYGLYRRDINKPAALAQEIVEGAEKMQLNFGVSHGHTINYLTITQLTPNDWQAIVSVQIALSLNSIDPVSERSPDRLLRQTWNATIAIREPISSVQ